MRRGWHENIMRAKTHFHDYAKIWYTRKKVFYSTCIPQLCALLDDITYFYSITFMFSGDRAFHADIDFAFDLLPTNPKLVGLSTISTTAIISRSIWNRHKMLWHINPLSLKKSTKSNVFPQCFVIRTTWTIDSQVKWFRSVVTVRHSRLFKPMWCLGP